MLDEGVQLREAGCGEGGDGVRQVRGRPIPLQAAQISNVRVHDQLHPQAQAPPGEIHDEQRARKLYYPPGEY